MFVLLLGGRGGGHGPCQPPGFALRADPCYLCLPTWLDAVHHGLALKSIDMPPSTQSSPSPAELPNRHHISPALGGISPGPSPPTIAVILIWGGRRAITVTHRRSPAPNHLPPLPYRLCHRRLTPHPPPLSGRPSPTTIVLRLPSY